MAFRRSQPSFLAGMAGALVLAILALLLNWATGGGLIRALGGVADRKAAEEPAKPLMPVEPVGPETDRSASPLGKWEAYAGAEGFRPTCDYRFHLIVPPEKAAKISVDLSRYTSPDAFIYATLASHRFLQAPLIAAGGAIGVDLGGVDGGNCPKFQAMLSDLPGMCFETTIEQRCE